MVRKRTRRVGGLVFLLVVPYTVQTTTFLVFMNRVVLVPACTKVYGFSILRFALCTALTLAKDRHPFLFGIRALFELQKTHLFKLCATKKR